MRATVTVDPATTVEQRDCVLGNDPGTGTFNTATVTPNIGDPSNDDDCRPIPNPNISVTKAATSGPTYDAATDTYSVAYDVVVSNTVVGDAGGGPGTYDLVDTPTFGAGTAITKVTVASAQIAGSPVENPANPIVDDEPISSGATHNYTVTVEFTVAGSTPATARDCVARPG